MVESSHRTPERPAVGGAIERMTVIAALAIAAISGIAIATLAIVTETSAAARETSAATRIVEGTGRYCGASVSAPSPRVATR